MVEKILAAVVLGVCALLLVRLMLGERRRDRLDAALRSVARSAQRAARSVQSVQSAWRWGGVRRASKKAAIEAIRRARDGSGVTREGNVYKPKSFRKPPRDKMH